MENDYDKTRRYEINDSRNPRRSTSNSGRRKASTNKNKVAGSNRRSKKGKNPFEQFTLENGAKLSSKIKVYDPPYESDSKANYNYIAENIEDWIETAINDRK